MDGIRTDNGLLLDGALDIESIRCKSVEVFLFNSGEIISHTWPVFMRYRYV